MIDPTKQDIGRTVRHRIYDKKGVGSWVEGKIEDIGRMMILVAVKGDVKEVNRADLEFVEP